DAARRPLPARLSRRCGDDRMDGGVGGVGVQAGGEGPAAAPQPGRVVDAQLVAEHGPVAGRQQSEGDHQVTGRVTDTEAAEVDDGTEAPLAGQQIAGVEVAVEPDRGAVPAWASSAASHSAVIAEPSKIPSSRSIAARVASSQDRKSTRLNS